ncbi:Hpt domain-containing protein [Rhodobaculum claviforme]|uniref:Histidine kinase n=1 Tax=Rhodobaculum claviforme TaxID=1549854 RepID=A0A934TIN7_9RHOB|nr:Hpt domain-containing protein [Rhodobaculum claviforme]MBK5926839.1 histidine kinase [Rhodobaculum claviforme]
MIDWDRVAELRSDMGAEDFLEVVALFLAEVQEAADRLSRSPAPERLEGELHFIKGSAYNLGFEALGALCTSGERMAAAGSAADVDVAAILACYAQSRREFLAGLDSLGGKDGLGAVSK